MAEEKLDEVEQPLPSKRKPSSDSEDSSKKLKIQLDNQQEQVDYQTIKTALNHSSQDHIFQDEDEDEDEDEERDYEDEDEDEDVADGVEVDRKGKGIMTHDIKGKGKLIEESDSDDSEDGDDDDDDDDDDGDEVDDSDLDEDPLAEVDLDNILPSRTRQRGRPPPHSGISLKDQDK